MGRSGDARRETFCAGKGPCAVSQYVAVNAPGCFSEIEASSACGGRVGRTALLASSLRRGRTVALSVGSPKAR